MAQPCFTSALLGNYGENGSEGEEDIKGAAGVLYTTGVDTTVSVLMTFIFAMVLYPEVYQKAQEEVDQVVGSDRLPDFHDRPSLRYLDCILKEVLRWNPAVPLGIPHGATEDDEYRGWDIPGGAIVIANIHAMTKDPDTYRDPELFRPERFLEQRDIQDPADIVFGFGRRSCPGRLFADANIWLAMVHITATFDISKALDKEGNEIAINAGNFTGGFVSHPKAFECTILPRSSRVVELLR